MSPLQTDAVPLGETAEPVAAIWGLGEADPLLLGVVVLSVLAFGIIYLVIRLQKKS